MSVPKSHHILPEFYLNGFCRDGLLWLFDREDLAYRRLPPRVTTVQRHFYSVTASDGTRDTFVETEFLARCEGPVGPIIAKLENNEQLSPQEMNDLAMFVAVLRFRTPEFQRMHNHLSAGFGKRMAQQLFATPEQAAALMAQTPAIEPGPDVPTAEELCEFAQSDDYTVKVNPNAWLGMMMNLAEEFAATFRQFDWLVAHAPSESGFATTDAPFVVTPPPGKPHLGQALLARGAMKYAPLSQKICLVMAGPGNLLLHRPSSKQEVRMINLIVASHSERFVIARDETQLRSIIERSKVDKYKAPIRVQMY